MSKGKKRKELNKGKRPELREVAVAQVQDKYSDYPSDGLTPVKLAAIFKEADAGDVFRQMELMEEMEEKDPHLFSQLQTRKNAVTGLDYEIIPFDSDDPMDKEIAQFVEDEIGHLENFEDIQMDLLDAIGKGFAVSEIIWGYDDGRIMIQGIKNRLQKRFFWDSLDDSFKVRTDEFPEGTFLPENKFLIHRYKARSGHPSRAGVLRVVSWMYLFKNYDLKDWVSFCEVYGLPLRLGKYAPGASTDDKNALMKALVQIGADAAGIIPDGTSIEFINTDKASSTDLFERLARYCDEQISKAILGQTLTSDSGGGSYAQSKTHNEVRHDLTIADCKALAATIRRDLIRPLVLYNFGEDRRIPYLRYDCEESGDLKDAAEVIGTLIEKTGLKIPTSYLYKKFSIPKPEGDEEIAQLPSAAPPFGIMKQTALKEVIPKDDPQRRVDQIISQTARRGQGLFSRMFAPVKELLETENSLEAVKDKLEEEAFVEKLLMTMEVDDFEELLQRAMTLANMEGRAMEDGSD